MSDYIDIGIDFGAENIVVIAIGYDNKGRIDYKLINLDSTTGYIKNYIGQRKDNSKIEIGSNVKVAYIYQNENNDYSWVSGRYKAYIAEKEYPKFEKSPNELLEFGLNQLINKIEEFDFTPLLSGKLRNLTIGVPQSWGFNKKLIYREILSRWKHGQVSLLSEPIAATIAGYKRSSTEIGNNIIMILDIGASTFDISFAKYLESEKKLNIYKTSYRSQYAGHYFDIVFASFVLSSETNKNGLRSLIDLKSKFKLKNIEDYINFIKENHSQYLPFLLELEIIKENNLLEIVKFNKKKLIDTDTNTPITVNKKMYVSALEYYTEKISYEVNFVISEFKKTEKTESVIYPFLCGGGSALDGLEKNLKNNMKEHKESENLFSIIKDGYGSKIDTTIAIGLAYYSQDKSIINKKLEYSIGVKIPDEEGIKKDYWILNEGNSYPLANDKKFSEFIDNSKELQYWGSGDGKISFPVLQKSTLDNNKIHTDIISISLEMCDVGDLFDLLFNVDIDGIITVTIKNLSKNLVERRTLGLNSKLLIDGGLVVI